jgi:hypothetical protein
MGVVPAALSEAGPRAKSLPGRRNRERPARRPSGMRLRASAAAGRSTALASLALSAAVAVALSGCGTAHGPGPTDPASVRIGSTEIPLTSARSPAQAQTPNQRAVADADAILASFAAPAGARRLPAAPTVEQGVLKSPAQVPGTPDLVDKAEWWIAAGAPQSVLAWEARHLPHRFSTAGTGTGSGPGFTTWTQIASLPGIPAVLDSRELVVTAVQDGDKTALRVDAQVTWQPARPASEQVPAAARAVTVSMDPGFNRGGKKPPEPVTITDQATVRKLTALINGLPLFPPGTFNCPADFGGSLVLTFRAGPGAPALAVATADLSGCGGVDLTIGGKSEPALAGPGTDSGPQILSAAGLSWKIPSE